MKNIIVLLFSLLVFEKMFSQTPIIPEWYLNYLFTPRPCGLSPTPIGLPLMWNAGYSREFLLKKLKKGENKATAIQYLGMLNDTSLINILEPYVSDTNESIVQAAISAIGKTGGSKAAPILEKCWRNNNLDWSMTMQIAHSLDLLCSPSSISLLNEIRQKFKGYFDKDENLRNEFSTVIERIQKCNESDGSWKQFIVNGINRLSGEENYSWAYYQIHRSKDKQYLPVLRDIQSSIMILPDLTPDQILSDSFPDINPNIHYDSILRLRMHLGEEQLTGEEKAYLSKKQHLLPLAKRMSFVQEEISRLEPYYKDKYSEGK